MRIVGNYDTSQCSHSLLTIGITSTQLVHVGTEPVGLMNWLPNVQPLLSDGSRVKPREPGPKDGWVSTAAKNHSLRKQNCRGHHTIILMYYLTAGNHRIKHYVWVSEAIHYLPSQQASVCANLEPPKTIPGSDIRKSRWVDDADQILQAGLCSATSLPSDIIISNNPTTSYRAKVPVIQRRSHAFTVFSSLTRTLNGFCTRLFVDLVLGTLMYVARI